MCIRRIRHYDEGFGNWHDSRVEPFGWYVNLNGSGLDTGPTGRPKLDEWWDAAGRGQYETGWLYNIAIWRDTFLTHSPDPFFSWHNHSWRIQPCSQKKLVQLTLNSPGYNILNETYAGGWSNYTSSWTGNSGYPSRRFATWAESPHYQGCYLMPGSVPLHRPSSYYDRLDGFPYVETPKGFLPPGIQNSSLKGVLDGYRMSYSDDSTLPCTFPSMPVAKMVDELVFIPELQEFSFSDVAFVDFQEWRTDWKTNKILSASAYMEALKRRPQSLNDFNKSCVRLHAQDRLHNMTLLECNQKLARFAASLKIIRINATAPQLPFMNGAILNGDRGVLTEESTKRGVYGYYNTWPSPVQGTLPKEWGHMLKNMEVIDFGIADKMLGFTNRVIGNTLQGTIPSTWGQLSKLWYLNIHQQIGMCAWSDNNTPFNIHLLAGKSNMEWYLNVTANQDWTTQRSALARDDLRTLWGAKPAVWHGWRPLEGPFTVHENSGTGDNRTVMQVFIPYNMTRLPFSCMQPRNNSVWDFTRLPEELLMWPVQDDETCLKFMNTDASMWGLESCWTQWPRDDSWDNPYLHFLWSEKSNYTYNDSNLNVMTLATSTYGFYEPFVQKTFRNMTFYGPTKYNDTQTIDLWRTTNFADWSATPWGPTEHVTSYKRQPSWDWAWRYTGSFWYSNYHFPMVSGMLYNGDLVQGAIRGRHHWGNNQCIGRCGGL